MQSTILENPYKFRFNIRPIRIAYFVRDDDVEALKAAIRMVCTQWGGIYHQLIPVDKQLKNLEWYYNWIKLLDPDWFALYSSEEVDLEFRDQITRFLENLFPERSIDLKIGTQFEQSDESAHPLHVFQVKELKDRQLQCPSISKNENKLLELILFGDIFPSQKDDYEEHMTLIEKEIHLGSNEFWENQFAHEPFSSVLNLTSWNTSAYKLVNPTVWTDYESIDIVVADSLTNYCLFWNLRALQGLQTKGKHEFRRTICLPSELLDDQDSLRRLFSTVKNKLFVPGRTANLDIQFYYYTDESIEKLKEAIGEISFVQQFPDKSIKGNPSFFNKERFLDQKIEERPLTYMFCRVTIPTNIFEGAWFNMPVFANLEFEQNEIRFDPPAEFCNRFRGVVSLDFECDVWLRYPKNERIAGAIQQGARFSKYGLSLPMKILARPQFQKFRLPTEHSTVELFFRASGYEVRKSRVEQYSSALIDLLGGIDGVSILASKSAYQLLDTLALKSTKKLAQRIVGTLGLQGTEDVVLRLLTDMELSEELKNIPRTLYQLNSDARIGLDNSTTLLDLVDHLTQAQVLRRGFYLLCPNCGTSEWYPLQTISEIVTCPGCYHSFALPAKESESSRYEMQWRYRLNSTVNRVMDQDVLVAVLAVHHLRQGKQSVCHRFGLELWKDETSVTDLDFFFVLEQEVYAGECKTGNRLGEKDIETAKLAAELGIDKFYFCTVESFVTESITAIEQLKDELKAADSSIEIFILTGSELFGESN